MIGVVGEPHDVMPEAHPEPYRCVDGRAFVHIDGGEFAVTSLPGAWLGGLTQQAN